MQHIHSLFYSFLLAVSSIVPFKCVITCSAALPEKPPCVSSQRIAFVPVLLLADGFLLFLQAYGRYSRILFSPANHNKWQVQNGRIKIVFPALNHYDEYPLRSFSDLPMSLLLNGGDSMSHRINTLSGLISRPPSITAFNIYIPVLIPQKKDHPYK